MTSRRVMMNDKIVSQSGNALLLEKCKGSYFNGLSVYGKSEQITTDGAQLLNPALYDKDKTVNGVTFTKQADGSVILTGKLTGTSTFYLGEYVDVLEDGKTYIYGSGSPLGVINITYNDGTSNGYLNVITVDKSRMVSIKPYIQFSIEKPAPNNIRILPMFNEGTVIKPWEPYSGGKPSPSMEYPQEIVNAGGDGKIEAQISGKNLLTGQMYYSNYSKGIAYIESFTNEVVLPYMPLVCTQGICYVFPCVSGKTYTFSVTNPNPNLTVRISEYKCLNDTSAYSKAIGYTNSPNINTFNTYTAKGNGVIVCALGGVWSSENPLIHKCTESELLQLEIGSAATSYEAYKQLQTLTLATPDGLPGIPVKSGGNYTDEKGQQWICDEIDLGRGKYVQRIKEVIINQDTKISTTLGNYGALEKDSILTRYLDRQIKKNGSVLCRELPCAPNWNYENESVYTTETSIDFRFSRQRLGLGTETTAEENKIAVLKFLETTPLHCLVELNDPIERVLTPEEIAAYKSLHTYSPNTTVVNDAGAGMAVSYRKVRG